MKLQVRDAELSTLQLQVHYYFRDEDRHSFDAFVRNDNEKDLLIVLKQSLGL